MVVERFFDCLKYPAIGMKTFVATKHKPNSRYVSVETCPKKKDCKEIVNSYIRSRRSACQMDVIIIVIMMNFG